MGKVIIVLTYILPNYPKLNLVNNETITKSTVLDNKINKIYSNKNNIASKKAK